jgi:hypothetical protein
MVRWIIPEKFDGVNDDGLTFDETIIADVKELIRSFKNGHTDSYIVQLKNGDSFLQPLNDKEIEEIEAKYDVEYIFAAPSTDNTRYSLRCYFSWLGEGKVKKETAELLRSMISSETDVVCPNVQ